ncbi:hypothetical protein ACJX0J_023583, partial [Zea mays]
TEYIFSLQNQGICTFLYYCILSSTIFLMHKSNLQPKTLPEFLFSSDSIILGVFAKYSFVVVLVRWSIAFLTQQEYKVTRSRATDSHAMVVTCGSATWARPEHVH